MQRIFLDGVSLISVFTVHGEDSSSVFCSPQGRSRAVLNCVLFLTCSSPDPSCSFSPKLGGRRVSQEQCCELWRSGPGHATGWGYGSLDEGKSTWERLPYTTSYEGPAACPACGTQKPQPRESLKSSFKKNGRDVALKCCTAVSYLRKCVKDSAQLPQGLIPVIKYIWFQSTCKKTAFKFVALFSGFCSAPRSSTGLRGRQFVNSPLEFLFLSNI